MALTNDEAVAAFESRLRQSRRASSVRLALTVAVAIPVLLISAHVGEVRPQLLMEKLPKLGNYIMDTMPVLRAESLFDDIAEWMWGFKRWLSLILDTMIIAFLGTLFGGVLAFATSFLAARNLAPTPLVGGIARRVMEITRTVPELVYALIFVYAFGVGPLAGVMAIILHSWGALGKLTAEANENIDMRPVEGAQAAGCNWLTVQRVAVVPQIMPNFTSYGLFRFEINVRSASVLGIVGAGGIGQELYLVVRQFEYPDISAIILMIIVLVSIIDILSGKLRHALIGHHNRISL